MHVSLSDCECIQRKESEETERLASANFKEQLQELQQLYWSFKMDCELDVSHILFLRSYDMTISHVDAMMLAEWNTFQIKMVLSQAPLIERKPFV